MVCRLEHDTAALISLSFIQEFYFTGIDEITHAVVAEKGINNQLNGI